MMDDGRGSRLRKKRFSMEESNGPVNKKLTETLERGKNVSKGKYVFLENGKPYWVLRAIGGQPLKR